MSPAEELAQFVGIPKCMDCKWKLGTDITDNCGCCGEVTPEGQAKHDAAFNRARELQSIISQNQNNQ